jgi:hypothetical protein
VSSADAEHYLRAVTERELAQEINKTNVRIIYEELAKQYLALALSLIFALSFFVRQMAVFKWPVRKNERYNHAEATKMIMTTKPSHGFTRKRGT